MKANLVDFAKANPQLQIVLRKQNHKHPHLIGEYGELKSNSNLISLVSGVEKQICIKNIEPEKVIKYINYLR
jgi:hypothetical protein